MPFLPCFHIIHTSFSGCHPAFISDTCHYLLIGSLLLPMHPISPTWTCLSLPIPWMSVFPKTHYLLSPGVTRPCQLHAGHPHWNLPGVPPTQHIRHLSNGWFSSSFYLPPRIEPPTTDCPSEKTKSHAECSPHYSHVIKNQIWLIPKSLNHPLPPLHHHLHTITVSFLCLEFGKFPYLVFSPPV